MALIWEHEYGMNGRIFRVYFDGNEYVMVSTLNEVITHNFGTKKELDQTHDFFEDNLLHIWRVTIHD